MRYAMMIAGSEVEWDSGTPDEIEAGMKATYAWFDTWGAKGKIADGGARLDRAATARTVQAGPSGTPVVTEGPFAELKEVLGGIVMLEADDLDDAVAVASTWPSLRGSTKIEIRPIIEM